MVYKPLTKQFLKDSALLLSRKFSPNSHPPVKDVIPMQARFLVLSFNIERVR